MKRYLTSYSKGVLNIRDRQTGNTKRVSNIDKDTADLFQDAVKSTNYNINTTKSSKVTIKSIYDLQTWVNASDKKVTQKWGDILPSNIKWESEYIKEKENNLSKQLDNLLDL